MQRTGLWWRSHSEWCTHWVTKMNCRERTWCHLHSLCFSQFKPGPNNACQSVTKVKEYYDTVCYDPWSFVLYFCVFCCFPVSVAMWPPGHRVVQSTLWESVLLFQVVRRGWSVPLYKGEVTSSPSSSSLSLLPTEGRAGVCYCCCRLLPGIALVSVSFAC